jgi:hypothetical protein
LSWFSIAIFPTTSRRCAKRLDFEPAEMLPDTFHPASVAACCDYLSKRLEIQFVDER